MKTAAIYIRVSTDDQTEHSPESQLNEIKKYAARNNLVIDPNHIYTDAGISGRKASKRPEFQRMISAAKAAPSPFDVILVWKFSRFARNQEESIVYKSLLRRDCGVEVISISEDIGDNIFGSLIERNIEWFDEFYSIQLSSEVRTKMTLVAEKGLVQTSPPFGYRKKHHESMQIVPDEAEWIRFIFSSFASGKSMLSIAKHLNDSGVRTRRGNNFDNRGIEYILHNPMYCGYVRWTPTGNTLGRRIYDSEDTIVKKGDFEPIVTKELFDRVQKLLSERKRTHKRCGKPSDMKGHWLSGLVRCSACGSSLSYSPAQNGFQCWKYAKGQCRTSHYISEKKLTAAVIEAIESVTVTEDFVIENTPIVIPESELDYDKQLDRISAMLDRAKAAYVAGIDTMEEYGENKKRILCEQDKILAKKKEAEDRRVLPPAAEVQKRFNGIVSLLKSDSGKDEKAAAVSAIVDFITFSRPEDSIKIFFRL